jgi:hypothetical protein
MAFSEKVRKCYLYWHVSGGGDTRDYLSPKENIDILERKYQ